METNVWIDDYIKFNWLFVSVKYDMEYTNFNMGQYCDKWVK